MNRLDDKVAIITGGARGQGASEAELFLQAGGDVFITDIDAKCGRDAADRLGSKCRFVEQDVSSEDSWTFLVDIVLECQGHIDVLVNNADLFHVAGLQQTSILLWDQIIAVNQTGVFLGMARGRVRHEKEWIREHNQHFFVGRSVGSAGGGHNIFGCKMGRTRNVEVCRNRVGLLWNSRKLGSSRFH